MRKILIYIWGFFLLFFVVPALCTVSMPKDNLGQTVASEDVTTEQAQQTDTSQNERY